MTIFMQGMRQSGTTITYDLFCADGSFETFYEPLAAPKAQDRWRQWGPGGRCLRERASRCGRRS